MSLEECLNAVGIPPPGDYVAAFNEFLRLSQDPRSATVPAVRLRRAEAAYRLGDFGSCLRDARWCALQDRHSEQAQLLEGLSALASAVGAGHSAPGLRCQVAEPTPLLLEEANRCLRDVLAKSPGCLRAHRAMQALRELRRRPRLSGAIPLKDVESPSPA